MGKRGTKQRTAAECDAWVSRYTAGESTISIARSEGVVPETVRKALIRRGVIIRPLRERAHREHAFDDTFFDAINTEAKAYWLGFIAADGNVHRYTLMIGLAVVDADHLRSFVRAISGTQRVDMFRKTDGHEATRVRINSIRTLEALARYGITPRKSLTLKWPELPPQAVRHFIRGYFDGNGTWHWVPSRVGRPTWTCAVVGSEGLVVGIRDALHAGCNANTVAIGRPGTPGFAKISYGGNQQVARIARYLYDGATVYLPRKKERADEAIAEANRTLRGFAAYGGACVDCGRSDRRYGGHGLCSTCYQRHTKREKPAA